MTNKPPLAFEAYEALAEEFAARVETKAHNAYYERPAMFSLLPDVRGMHVFDAGCGPGVTAERLLQRGAKVTCVDFSPNMVKFARARLGTRATVYLADLNKPLPFLESGSIDVVVASLVVDYLHDLRQTYHEVRRVLKRAGTFVFSFTHPFSNLQTKDWKNYFEPQVLGMTWTGFGKPVYVPQYVRSLTEILAPLGEAGLTIDRLVEPLPIPEFEKFDPESYAELMRLPGFMIVRARCYGVIQEEA